MNCCAEPARRRSERERSGPREHPARDLKGRSNIAFLPSIPRFSAAPNDLGERIGLMLGHERRTGYGGMPPKWAGRSLRRGRNPEETKSTARDPGLSRRSRRDGKLFSASFSTPSLVVARHRGHRPSQVGRALHPDASGPFRCRRGSSIPGDAALRLARRPTQISETGIRPGTTIWARRRARGLRPRRLRKLRPAISAACSSNDTAKRLRTLS